MDGPSPPNGPAEPHLKPPSQQIGALVHWLANQVEEPLTPLELAEILWLGTRIPPLTITQAPLIPEPEPKPLPPKPNPDKPVPPEPDYSSEPLNEALPSFFPTDPPREHSEPEALLLPEAVLPDAVDTDATLPVQLAEAPLLGDRFSLLHAFRPLLARRKDPRRLQLNEPRTVENYAECRLLLPVMEARLEPWFEDVLLLMDGGVSMQVWRKLADELRHVLSSSQVFAQVRLEYLRPEDLGAGAEEVPLLLPPSGSLLLFITDAAGRHWWDNRMFNALEGWCRSCPTAIVQMLPIWHWERTALAAGDRVSVNNSEAAAPNTAYTPSALDWWEEDLQVGNGFTVPVIPPDRGPLASWSAMVMGDRSNASTGVQLPECAERRDRLRVLLGDRNVLGEPDAPADRAAAEALWQDFRQVASPQAQRLLMVMAAAPVLTLPVMGLLKEAKVPESTTPLPISEVLVSSLVRRRDGQEGVSDPDRLQFELLPELAELLLERLSPGDRMDVIRAVSEVVERRWNQLGVGPSFEAALCDPSVPLPEGMKGIVHFASVTARLLETLPGESYRRFAERLRQGVELEPAEVWAKEDYPFEPLAFTTALLLRVPEPEPLAFTTARFQEIDLQLISFETARLTIGTGDVQIHPSTATAWAFFEPVQRDRLLPGDVADAAHPLTLTMVEIPAGDFQMGSSKGETQRYDDEGPQHRVQLQGFFMSQTPVTQAQWKVVAGWDPREGEQWERKLNPNPSRFQGENARLLEGESSTDQRPVEQVSWHDAMEFCSRLSHRTGRIYTLPSEAQWEYSCRAGTPTPFAFGETITPELANYNGNSVYGDGPKGEYRQQTTPVGCFPANAWGLHDMHGNVWEWCLDHWHGSYEVAPEDGSAWLDPEAGENADRLLRGGSWGGGPRDCRSAYRVPAIPAASSASSGSAWSASPRALLDS